MTKNRYNISYTSLFLFSVPSILATLVEPIVELVDSAIIGPMGPDYLSALSANSAIFAISIWVFNFLVHVGSAEVAAARAQKNQAQLQEGIVIGLLLPLVIGFCVATVLFLSRDFLLVSVMQLGDVRYPMAKDYFDYRLFSLPLALLLSSCCGILRGLGKVRLALNYVLAMTTANVLMTLILVEVFQLGLKGAAIGTVFGLAVTAVPLAIFIFRTYIIGNRIRLLNINLDYFKSYLQNSYNQFLRTVAISLSFFIAAKYANATNAVTGASHQILLHYWLLASYVLDGFSVTATTIGADLWFSKKYKRWFIFARRLLVMSLLMGTIFSVIYLLNPKLIYIFTRDREVYQQTLSVWLVVGLFQIPNSILYTYDGLFFSQKNFAYIRKKIWQAFIIFFIPIILFRGDDLMFIWIAICALNSYRFVSFSIKLMSQNKKIHHSQCP